MCWYVPSPSLEESGSVKVYRQVSSESSTRLESLTGTQRFFEALFGTIDGWIRPRDVLGAE